MNGKATTPESLETQNNKMMGEQVKHISKTRLNGNKKTADKVINKK